jgi:ubiquinone/menaquinone biosynthesis C-methylase UbiE/predicted transcriptional regulator
VKGKDPKDIGWLRRISAFAPSRIILTANKYRIFDYLEGRGRKADALSKAIGTDRRATELLLNSLVAIGLLEKKGGNYRNAGVASRYLVKGKTDYQGDILRHNDVLWDNWSGLDEVVKTGRPNRKSHDHESFILGMHNLALQKVREVLKNIDLKGIKKVLDLGGGPGTYSLAFAKKKMEVTLLDFPDTLRISKKVIASAGMEKEIRLLPGDFMKDELGSGYDMIFISQILHAYGPDECIALIRKCRASLEKGGRVVLQEFHLDESRTSPLQGAVFAINMLVNTPRGRTYTPYEMSAWMNKAGLRVIDKKILDETVLITATKKWR